MSNPTQYTDPSGNVYTNFTAKGKVTPYGYHFKNLKATVQFVAYVLWLACFTTITIGICCVRSRNKDKPAAENASHKYLRWPVIGLSTICMVLIYTLQVYNRIVHEIEEQIRWYYPAIIGILADVLVGFAQGLLIAFLLWQLTPILLVYGKISASKTKWTIRFCRLLAWLINLVNTADTIAQAVTVAIEVQKFYFDIKSNPKEDKAAKIVTIDDAALTAAFTGGYVICVLIFAAVAGVALQKLTSDHKRFKFFLSLLTVAMIFRSLLDFIWALVFKVWALRPKLNLEETLTTNMIRTVLYGLFSTIVYASILGIATLPLPDRGEGEVAWQHLPLKEQHWHKRLSFTRPPVAIQQVDRQWNEQKSPGNEQEEYYELLRKDVIQVGVLVLEDKYIKTRPEMFLATYFNQHFRAEEANALKDEAELVLLEEGAEDTDPEFQRSLQEVIASKDGHDFISNTATDETSAQYAEFVANDYTGDIGDVKNHYEGNKASQEAKAMYVTNYGGKSVFDD